jgi:hypothetical protein
MNSEIPYKEGVKAKGPQEVGCYIFTLHVTYKVLLDRPPLQHYCDVIIPKVQR